jgi:hypothetical protein
MERDGRADDVGGHAVKREEALLRQFGGGGGGLVGLVGEGGEQATAGAQPLCGV